MPLKAEELPKVIEYLSIPDDVDTFDKLKTNFEQRFTLKSNIDEETRKKITDTAFHRISESFVKDMKTVGIEFAKEEIEGKRLEDQLAVGIAKFKDEKAKFEAFKKTAGDPTKEYADLEGKFKTLETQYNEASNKYNAVTTEFETFKTTKDSELKNFKLKTMVNELYEKEVHLSEGTPELSKKGYFATLNELYSPDLDEKTGEVYAINNATGKREAGKQAGKDKLYKEVFPEVGIKLNVWKLNNQSKNQSREPIKMEPQQMSNVVQPLREVAKRIS